MKLFLVAVFSLFTIAFATAQVQYSAGPALENDRDVKVNRMLAGDDITVFILSA